MKTRTRFLEKSKFVTTKLILDFSKVFYILIKRFKLGKTTASKRCNYGHAILCIISFN